VLEGFTGAFTGALTGTGVFTGAAGAFGAFGAAGGAGAGGGVAGTFATGTTTGALFAPRMLSARIVAICTIRASQSALALSTSADTRAFTLASKAAWSIPASPLHETNNATAGQSANIIFFITVCVFNNYFVLARIESALVFNSVAIRASQSAVALAISVSILDLASSLTFFSMSASVIFSPPAQAVKVKIVTADK
jgi:hypothetical protein